MSASNKVKWYLKVTDKDGKPFNGGHGKYKLSTSSWSVGEWHVNRKPVLCESGWHVTDLDNLRAWCNQDCRIFVVETRGKSAGSMSADDKMCFESFRFVFEVRKWMIDHAIRDVIPGMTARDRRKLLYALIDEERYDIINEFPVVRKRLAVLIDQKIKKYIY